ncbi:hypothetical protein [Micromonospora sp. CB01531]|uniref:hypothetical protein n=1 Tax=Micromonospora sp. CB01531 TaxID=1718947 RepID=UPI00093C55F7|nr:hypothetical protein [Micromonospora sp. CB01531]OKI81715.1 hypothetical protein A6A27_16685 [Micromonospora sp. CB01531]
MPYLIAALLLVGALGALNLLLALGVIRRLREHTKLLDALYEYVGATRTAAPGEGARGPSAGDVVGEFTATTVDGLPLAPDLLATPTVVAFLSPDCGGCREQLPELLDWARGQDRQRVLAVVDGRSGDPADLVEALNPVAQVVVEAVDGPVANAFRVQAYPLFCVLGEGGVLTAVLPRVSRLPVGTAA